MTEPAPELTGTILHLQRLSTEDGPGIRTTVFFKGCPLHCAWCHNPESFSTGKQVQWIGNRCIGCDSCLEACEQGGLSRYTDGIHRDRTVCTVCGRCVEECPTGAMELLGQEVTVAGLVSELIKDRTYFEKSGGGVTLSGGEPALQPGFAVAVMRSLKDQGIHVALDTCGLCTPDTLTALTAMADLVLFDLKLLANAQHERWTGAGNVRILENLQSLRSRVAESNGRQRLWVRTPLIPGATAGQANLHAIGVYLAEHMDGTIERWELCAFNNLCRDKYKRLGLTWAYAKTPLMSAAELEEACAWAKASGFDSNRVYVTGSAKAEN